MASSKMSIEAIKAGAVIDHIPAGQAIAILRLLKLLHHQVSVTVGFNLPSTSLGKKDVIKISRIRLSKQEESQLALFAPKSTLNTIEDFKVIEKKYLQLPESIREVFRCPNENCASHSEPVSSYFYVIPRDGGTVLRCHYCEKTYARELVTYHQGR